MYRLDGGQPIRTAMDAAGLSIERLAGKTKEVDPAGYGIARSTIGHMVSTGTSGRLRFTPRSSGLVAAALDRPVPEFFGQSPT